MDNIILNVRIEVQNETLGRGRWCTSADLTARRLNRREAAITAAKRKAAKSTILKILRWTFHGPLLAPAVTNVLLAFKLIKSINQMKFKFGGKTQSAVRLKPA